MHYTTTTKSYENIIEKKSLRKRLFDRAQLFTPILDQSENLLKKITFPIPRIIFFPKKVKNIWNK